VAASPNNFVPISLAVILHVLLFGSMLVAFDWARPTPFTPMVIQATLVTEIPEYTPPVIEEEPEPEPVVEEPEPEPDNSAELRRQAEEEKRIQDAFIEKERLEKIRQQKERDEAERLKMEEERKERERKEAERKREQDIQRQREENERLRKELEAEQRDQEIADEERRMAANSSPAMDAYKFAIAQKIRRNWSVPASATDDTLCTVNVKQIAGGVIVDVTILNCNGDDAVKRSVEAAVRKSSPLPDPSTPDLFSANLTLNLRPEMQD
jgi:colicin import membrane protein